METEKNRSEHRTFVLRLWRESEAYGQRATLADVRSGEKRHFSNLAQLSHFLLFDLARDGGLSGEKAD